MKPRSEKFKQIILEYLLTHKDQFINKTELYRQVQKHRHSNLGGAAIAIDYLYQIGAIKTSNFRYRGIEKSTSTFDCKITDYGIKYLENMKKEKSISKPDTRFTEVRTYHVPPDLLQNAIKHGLSIDDLIKACN
jgi:hypothetical protein